MNLRLAHAHTSTPEMSWDELGSVPVVSHGLPRGDVPGGDRLPDPDYI